jgi:hypothetical protein
MSHWEESLIPLPIGQFIAFFYYDLTTNEYEILSSYFRVPYVSDRAIEQGADRLLYSFQATGKYRPTTYDPPAKYLSQIIRHLGFDMEPRDLQWELGSSVIAATDFERKIIAYDVSLDKDNDNESLIITSGSHECGHIVHRHDRFIEIARKSVALHVPNEFRSKPLPSKLGSYVVCRRPVGAKPRIEFMCDQFMGCLLMPRQMVAEFVKDHKDWCFSETGAGWHGLALIMARNFKVNLLTAAGQANAATLHIGYFRRRLPDSKHRGLEATFVSSGIKNLRENFVLAVK